MQIAFLTPQLQLTAAVSRKMHGALGPFDIDFLNANFGPECRSSGNHTLVFTFANDVVSGNASCHHRDRQRFGAPTFSGTR